MEKKIVATLFLTFLGLSFISCGGSKPLLNNNISNEKTNNIESEEETSIEKISSSNNSKETSNNSKESGYTIETDIDVTNSELISESTITNHISGSFIDDFVYIYYTDLDGYNCSESTHIGDYSDNYLPEIKDYDESNDLFVTHHTFIGWVDKSDHECFGKTFKIPAKSRDLYLEAKFEITKEFNPNTKKETDCTKYIDELYDYIDKYYNNSAVKKYTNLELTYFLFLNNQYVSSNSANFINDGTKFTEVGTDSFAGVMNYEYLNLEMVSKFEKDDLTIRYDGNGIFIDKKNVDGNSNNINNYAFNLNGIIYMLTQNSSNEKDIIQYFYS